MSVVDRAIKPHWRVNMIKDNETIDSFQSMSEAQSYFSRLEETDALEGKDDDEEESSPPKKAANSKGTKRTHGPRLLQRSQRPNALIVEK